MYFFIWSYVFSSVRYRSKAHPQLASYLVPLRLEASERAA
jgi:hypothetical protein